MFKYYCTCLTYKNYQMVIKIALGHIQAQFLYLTIKNTSRKYQIHIPSYTKACLPGAVIPYETINISKVHEYTYTLIIGRGTCIDTLLRASTLWQIKLVVKTICFFPSLVILCELSYEYWLPSNCTHKLEIDTSFTFVWLSSLAFISILQE